MEADFPWSTGVFGKRGCCWIFCTVKTPQSCPKTRQQEMGALIEIQRVKQLFVNNAMRRNIEYFSASVLFCFVSFSYPTMLFFSRPRSQPPESFLPQQLPSPSPLPQPHLQPPNPSPPWCVWYQAPCPPHSPATSPSPPPQIRQPSLQKPSATHT